MSVTGAGPVYIRAVSNVGTNEKLSTSLTAALFVWDVDDHRALQFRRVESCEKRERRWVSSA